MEKTFKEMVLTSASKHGIELSQEAKLMIHGIKPAWLTTKRRRNANFLASWYSSIGLPHRNDAILIFKDGQTMYNFVQEGLVIGQSRFMQVLVDDKTIRSHTFIDYKHDVVGRYLGYTPMAVEWSKTHKLVPRDQITREDVRFYYHGITFVSGIDTIEDIIDWLFKDMPIPDNLKTYADYTVFNKNREEVKTVRFDCNSKYLAG